MGGFYRSLEEALSDGLLLLVGPPSLLTPSRIGKGRQAPLARRGAQRRPALSRWAPSPPCTTKHSLNLTFYLPIYLSIYLSIHLSIHIYTYRWIYLYMYIHRHRKDQSSLERIDGQGRILYEMCFNSKYFWQGSSLHSMKFTGDIERNRVANLITRNL